LDPDDIVRLTEELAGSNVYVEEPELPNMRATAPLAYGSVDE
jgi:hypothetical protein